LFWALALILLAVAAFSAGVAWMPRRAGAAEWIVDRDQLRGFLYVGAGALLLLAIAVIIAGLVAARTGVAEALAVLGFFGYALYLLAAAVITLLSRRRGG
jgi:hypothetical protein